MTSDDPEDVDPFDDDAAPPGPVDGEEPEHSPVAGPADPLFGGIDVAAFAAGRVETAVNKAIGTKIDQLAAEAVAKALTPDVLAQLTAEADEAAQLAVRGRQAAASDTSEHTPAVTHHRRLSPAAVLRQRQRVRPRLSPARLQAQYQRHTHLLVAAVVDLR